MNAEKIIKRLDELIAKLDDVPDFDALNKRISRAENAEDAGALAKAKAEKQKALDSLADRMTAADIKKELDSIVADIEEGAASGGGMSFDDLPTAPGKPG